MTRTPAPHIPPNDLHPVLLVIGASARAAAWSAHRLGPVLAIDQFGDTDLRAIADVTVADRYPDDLADLARGLPSCPWMYTGAMENHPEIVRTISGDRPLLGCDADVLEAVRDPFALAASLADAGLPHLPVRRHDAPPPVDGTWIRKPLRGAAGRGIVRWTGDVRRSTPAEWFQRFARGPSCSAVYVARPNGCSFAGATRQTFRTGAPFEWNGNVGPLDLDTGTREALVRLGEHVAGRFGLRGLFGIDYVLEEGRPLLVEVNPRYTASVEVLERARGPSLLAEHLDACGVSLKGSSRMARDGVARADVVCKIVLFATRPTVWSPGTRPPAGTQIADVPVEGMRIETGQPICTLITWGPTADVALTRRDSAAASLLR